MDSDTGSATETYIDGADVQSSPDFEDGQNEEGPDFEDSDTGTDDAAEHLAQPTKQPQPAKKRTCEKHRLKAQKVRGKVSAMTGEEKLAYDLKNNESLRNRRAKKKLAATTSQEKQPPAKKAKRTELCARLPGRPGTCYANRLKAQRARDKVAAMTPDEKLAYDLKNNESLRMRRANKKKKFQ